MDVNFVRLFFLQISIIAGAIWFSISNLENYLPVTLTRFYRYGKSAVVTDDSLMSKFEVPKRYFKHFYKFAAPASSIALLLIISRYILLNPVPDIVNLILNFGFGTGRNALVSPETTLLAIIILNVQCWKRFYESHYVSIFSDGNMNLSIYFVGFAHYVGTISCIIGESEGFVPGSNNQLRWHRITKLQYVCASIFLIASYEQLKTNVILANLRKDKSGNIVTKSHKIPKGRLFKYISAPLQFTEIVMYAMLSIILWRSSTYHCVFLWVLLNQTATATMSHLWYLKKFDNYPQERKIIVPFLY